ncbi:RNase HII [Pelagirhabdus alkalitolerans]|uniref:Ribonuclease HII n=1 Tax=Pelagirhabdus alkalitolerans TaxID=1612202 RepID=A0A1G6H3I8_9BACI|nr:ribonuclease HII [Pelagirhabdus alkalitolerans]SDB88465.1 RNase HII [Pelagirhabdus alkalitolerans]
MKQWTVNQVKDMFKTGNFSEKDLECLKADQRKGIQQEIKRYERQKEQIKQQHDQFVAMTQYEHQLYEQNIQYIAGIDEVGRGPLAGPVVAAAVILSPEFDVLGLTDSKQLSEKKREMFASIIEEKAEAIGVGIVHNDLIDQHNIYQASIMAMEDAIDNLSVEPDYLLIDAVELKRLGYDQQSIIKGDQKSISIAAASIIAKVTRDRMMKVYHKKYPGYGFDQNQGYGTKAHLQGLKENGPSPIHRYSFAPVKQHIRD